MPSSLFSTTSTSTNSPSLKTCNLNALVLVNLASPPASPCIVTHLWIVFSSPKSTSNHPPYIPVVVHHLLLFSTVPSTALIDGSPAFSELAVTLAFKAKFTGTSSFGTSVSSADIFHLNFNVWASPLLKLPSTATTSKLNESSLLYLLNGNI